MAFILPIYKKTINTTGFYHNNNQYQSQNNTYVHRINWYPPRKENIAPLPHDFEPNLPDISSRLMGIANNDIGKHVYWNPNPNVTNNLMKQKLVEAFTQSMNSVLSNF